MVLIFESFSAIEMTSAPSRTDDITLYWVMTDATGIKLKRVQGVRYR
jgi:hypothetical protein